MFDTSMVDLIVLVPIVASFVFGALIKMVEGRSDVRPFASGALLATFYTALLGFSLYLKTSLSGVSIILLQGLFKVDTLSVSFAVASVIFFSFAALFQLRRSEGKVENSQLFYSLGLLLALTFSHNLIFIFLFFELLLIKALVVKNKKLSFRDLEGARVRLVGLVLILGSVAINFGAGRAATIDFVKTKASVLYSADYLFLIGSLFILSGFIKVAWSLFEAKIENFNVKTLVAGLGFSMAVLKYSSAGVFAVLQEAQILIQWLCVLSLMFAVHRIHKASYMLDKMKYIFLSSLLLGLIFNLSHVFDGEGSQSVGLAYLYTVALGILLWLFVDSDLSSSKGGLVTFEDLTGLSKKLPRQTFLILISMALTLAFPLGLGFLILSSGLKMSFQTGFYWVGFWTLCSVVGLWSEGVKGFVHFYLKGLDVNTWTLWKTDDVLDINRAQAILLTVFAVGSPLISIYLFMV